MLGTLSRWTLGFCFFSLGYWLLETAIENKRNSLLFGSMGLFVLGALSFWKTVFFLATRPLMLFIDSLFFPGGRLEKPSLNLKLPSHYLSQERYTEALEEYRKIMKFYPEEPEAYEKAAWLYLHIFGEKGAAERVIRRAKRRNVELSEQILQMVKHSRSQSRASAH